MSRPDEHDHLYQFDGAADYRLGEEAPPRHRRPSRPSARAAAPPESRAWTRSINDRTKSSNAVSVPSGRAD